MRDPRAPYPATKLPLGGSSSQPPPVDTSIHSGVRRLGCACMRGPRPFVARHQLFQTCRAARITLAVHAAERLRFSRRGGGGGGGGVQTGSGGMPPSPLHVRGPMWDPFEGQSSRSRYAYARHATRLSLTLQASAGITPASHISRSSPTHTPFRDSNHASVFCRDGAWHSLGSSALCCFRSPVSLGSCVCHSATPVPTFHLISKLDTPSGERSGRRFHLSALLERRA